MSMMAFITLCWKSRDPEPRTTRPASRWGAGGFWHACWVLALTFGLAHWGGVAMAASPALEITELRVERSDNALTLSSQLRLELSPAIEDALVKGLALYFVAEADVLRERWYWTDRKVASVSRHYRLAYQPLARRWRLHVSSEPINPTGLNGSLAQSYDTLSDALQGMRRQTQWPLAEVSAIENDAPHVVNYRFRLDTSQLPRPFQLVTGNQADWSLSVSRSLKVPSEALR